MTAKKSLSNRYCTIQMGTIQHKSVVKTYQTLPPASEGVESRFAYAYTSWDKCQLRIYSKYVVHNTFIFFNLMAEIAIYELCPISHLLQSFVKIRS